MAIDGKVAKILNERELVINQGSKAGVRDKMEFAVMEPTVNVLDPDTLEVLGSLNRGKIRVRIVGIHQEFSIGRTYETYRTIIGPLQPFVDAFALDRSVRRVRTLRTKDPDALREESSFVKVGDPVVEVEEEARVQD